MSMRRRIILAGGGVGAIVAIALAWWLGSPLFVSNVVDEAFPFEMPESAAMASMPAEEKQQIKADFDAAMPSTETIESLSPEDRERVQERVMDVAAKMPDTVMEEPMPAGLAGVAVAAMPAATPAATAAATATPAPTAMPDTGPAMVAMGTFSDADEFHRGSGSATMFRGPDGNHILRFEDFMVTNGPALSVLLSTATGITSSENLGEYLDLGPLKGNIGNQNYEVPAGTDVGTIPDRGDLLRPVPRGLRHRAARLASGRGGRRGQAASTSSLSLRSCLRPSHLVNQLKRKPITRTNQEDESTSTTFTTSVPPLAGVRWYSTTIE